MKYYFRNYKAFKKEPWREVSYEFLQYCIDDAHDDCCVVVLVKAEKEALYFEYTEFES